MEEKTVQREDVLGEAIQILEIEGIANTTLEMVAERVAYPLNDLKRFWPDQEALLYDALRYLSHQVDAWRRQLDAATLRTDLLAGVTVALVAIPQALAYAQLAGLPAYVGLYASLLPSIVAALFGSSPQLNTGPVAQGGWNLAHTTNSVPDQGNPLSSRNSASDEIQTPVTPCRSRQNMRRPPVSRG